MRRVGIVLLVRISHQEGWAMYDTLLGCCATLMDELIVQALYAAPTCELAAQAARLLNERGYDTMADEILEHLYD